MAGQPYDEIDWELNYRTHSDKYVVGRGLFGVLKYQPYKSEILPHWDYENEQKARESAEKIYDMFKSYLDDNDFPGADMARKYLRMGFTRAMRYAKYPGGKKYNDDGSERDPVTPDEPGHDEWAAPDKRDAAQVYHKYWDKAREHDQYQKLKAKHTADQNS